MPTKQRPEEQWVQRVLALALPSAVVGQHDDGSSAGMYDIDVQYLDGRTAAVEVTAAAHPEALALWRLINKEMWVERSLRGGWAVNLLATANYRLLRERLPTILLQLEAEGVMELRGSGRSTSTLSREANELGIVSAYQGGTELPGSIYPLITLPSDRTGGFVSDTGDPLAQWLSDWISEPKRSDNLRKLSASSRDERHLFVIVAGLGDVPFQVTDLLIRNDARLPTIPLILPPEITHVWVMSTWSAGLGFRWSPSPEWQTFDKLITTWLGSA
jgi:hypothetical protein